MRTWILAALGVVLAATPAMAADQFDLNCVMKEKVSAEPGKTHSFKRHWSIDLDAGEYCYWEDGCNQLSKIAQATDDEIRLDDVDDEVMRLVTTINRKTWRLINHAEVKQGDVGTSDTEGDCKVAPFTAFPANAAPPPPQ